MVEALAELSHSLGGEIECHLGDTYVGSLESGVPDRLIKEGLLGEWEQQLDQRGRTAHEE